MWQSSMLISLIVLAHKQIQVTIWGVYSSMNRGPIKLLEPLVEINWHIFLESGALMC